MDPEGNNPEEQKQSSLSSAINSGKNALEKGKKAKKNTENFVKVIRTILTSKGALIALAVIILIILFIINAAAFIHFLDLKHNSDSVKAKNKAFSGGILERRKN